MIYDPKKDSHLVFEGVRFNVRAIDITTKSGNIKRREFIEHPGAVVILPLLEGDHVVMIRNYRIAVNETLWELPAGTLEPKEPPKATAARELVEETGYRSEDIEPLTTFYTTPGICNETMYAFVAKSLQYEGQKLEEGEEITVEAIPYPKALELIRTGEIRDAKSIATLLYYESFSTS